MVKLLLVDENRAVDFEHYHWLCANNFVVEVAEDTPGALSFLASNNVDVMLVVQRGAGVSGIQICRAYRQIGGQTPILVFAMKQDSSGHLFTAEATLDAGADDFVFDECRLAELTARIRALLRRPPNVLENLLTAGPISMNTLTGIVKKDGKEVHLQPMELNLLEFLLRHPNQVFSAQVLHLRVWPEPTGQCSVSDTVRTHIKTLRRKLGCPLIKTVHGRGYKLQL